MKPFNNLTKLFLFIPYYLIHKNYFFGLIFKIFCKRFNFLNLSFEIDDYFKTINLSSFLFKTYEYNDRYLVLKHISYKNKCIVLGGGIGFIASLVYKKSKNKILIFEINNSIIELLKKNLTNNNIQYKLINKNLIINEEVNANKFFFKTDNILETSIFLKTNKKEVLYSINSKSINNFSDYNTLIIDAEGVEKYYISKLKELKSIEYIIFELHYNILSKSEVRKMFNFLELNSFQLVDQSFNSYYFKKTNS